MNHSIVFKSIFSIIAVFFLLVFSSCESSPGKAQGDIWSMLASGDSRAREYFLGRMDVHTADPAGKTPLHYAAELQDAALASFFISLGAEVDAVDKENQTPLGISAGLGDALTAKALVTAGADIHKPAKDGESPAQTALFQDGAFLRAMLTPASLDSTDALENSILHLAVINGGVESLGFILEEAGNFPADSTGATALSNAIVKKNGDGKNALDLALARTDSAAHMEIAEQLILAGAVSENPVYFYLAPAVRSANYNLRRQGGVTPLHSAAQGGHEGLITFLVQKKAGVNIKNASGATPLHEAARSGNIGSMEILLDSGAEADAQDAKGNSALHIGIPEENHLEAIALLLNRGANPNLRDEHGESPLHIACTLNRNESVVQALLGGGADVDIRNIEGKTPLYLAVQDERTGLIPSLLVYGSSIFAADNAGVTPFELAMKEKGAVLDALITPESVTMSDSAGNTLLHFAAKNSADPLLVEKILGQRAQLNARNKEGDTALLLAVRFNRRENGEFLLSRGADIFASNSSGESPLYLALASPDGVREWMFTSKTAQARDGLGNTMLHYAAQWKMDRHIPFIIAKGVPVNAANATGETPLFMAAMYNGPSTVKTLLIERASLQVRDSLGNSVLHAAVRWNAKNAALALIEAGIDVNAHSLNGIAPLHEAVRLGNADFETLLIDRGADLEVRDTDGNTPFMEAVKTASVGSMELLFLRGSDPMTRNARGDTPLHMAVAMERVDMAKKLLQMGVSIHARNTRNRTPFQTALGVSQRMIAALLEKDRVNSPDDFGNSALHIALQEKAAVPMVKTIIEKGCRLSAVDSNGRTPLRLACDMGSWEQAKLLADSGSDPFSTAVDGKTAAEAALANGSEGITALFSGRAINAQDASGNTILHYAARQGKPENISLLLELGANKGVRNIAMESPADIAERWNHRENAALLN
jgi:ankyrin repeat protein